MERPESTKYQFLENSVMGLDSKWDRHPNITQRLN